MVGEMLPIHSPSLEPNDLALVKLHALEPAGIWVEYQNYTDRMLKKFQQATSLTTLIVFLPWVKIDYIVTGIESVAISEEALGMWEDSCK
jgi:hypothetical protein